MGRRVDCFNTGALVYYTVSFLGRGDGVLESHDRGVKVFPGWTLSRDHRKRIGHRGSDDSIESLVNCTLQQVFFLFGISVNCQVLSTGGIIMSI